MMMWDKKGQIFKASGQSEYMASHTCPINAVVLDDRVRVFFSSRVIEKNGNYVSYPGFVDLDINDLQKVIYLSQKPLIKPGGRGMFDRHGVMLYKSVWYEGRLFMYYGGWHRLASKDAPYQVLLGLAISDDKGESFTKISEGPIMGMDIYDPLSIGNVSVVIKNGIWYMYYTTFKRWEYNGVKPTPEYNIKLAISEDGINWEKRNEVVIEENEMGGVATPCVFEYNNKYIMYFGYRRPYDEDGRAGRYRIGYAESEDLINWIRDDGMAGINVSNNGWDSDMVCYPSVVKIKEKYLMFYCGNGYGESGFGYAELVDKP